MHVPNWQLPAGVDRGLADYLRSTEMVTGYDAAMQQSPLAVADIAFCEDHFARPGSLIDLGTGTGRLCLHFAAKGFRCTGVDLSEAMLDQARRNDVESRVAWRPGNIVELTDFADASFDYAACLFSTLGMVRGTDERRRVVQNAFRVLRPGGAFVVHVHNRWFPALGWRRFLTANHTTPQAYGGAPLTLHHFTRREVSRLLNDNGFRVGRIRPVHVDIRPRWIPYGYLIAAAKPASMP
jgi:ubiquinone/menaquinone biosynthesis C-methylase UbiE